MMAIPSNKSPAMEELLDGLLRSSFSNPVGRRTSILNDICATCGGPATTFTDELSRYEYTISGMCQTCQDNSFNG